MLNRSIPIVASSGPPMPIGIQSGDGNGSGSGRSATLTWDGSEGNGLGSRRGSRVAGSQPEMSSAAGVVGWPIWTW